MWIQPTFLISSVLLLTLGPIAPIPAATDYTSFYKAVETGDAETALSLGLDLYTRLAFQAGGQGVFYDCGVMLASVQQAYDSITDAYANPQSNGFEAIPSLWRILPPAVREPSPGAANEEPGRFLRTYMGLCVSQRMERILAAAKATSTMPASATEGTTDHLVLLAGMLDAGAMGSLPGVKGAIQWIVASKQDKRAIAQGLEHDRPQVACAVVKARLAGKPDDAEARKALVELVTALCKSQRVPEALALCAWAKEITQDGAYSSILVLQQAVIAGRDQKNYALAVRLCDEVAGAAGDANTTVVAKYMAGTFSLEQKEYGEVVRRMDLLRKDSTTPLPYRLKATATATTALIRQAKHEEAVRVATQALEGLGEQEPAEAGDCRQVLCQALLGLQRYAEATQQCKVLIARHPGRPGAKAAAEMLEQMIAKSDKTAESSK